MPLKNKMKHYHGDISLYSPAGTPTWSLRVKTEKILCAPVVSSILQNRRFVFIILFAAFLQTGLTMLGRHAWPCPFRTILGVPCPGCGLSTGMALLVHGEWTSALAAHIFSPIILAGFVLMICIFPLPERYYAVVVRKIEGVEKATGITTVLIGAMILYWASRLWNAF